MIAERDVSPALSPMFRIFRVVSIGERQVGLRLVADGLPRLPRCRGSNPDRGTERRDESA